MSGGKKVVSCAGLGSQHRAVRVLPSAMAATRQRRVAASMIEQ